MSDTAAITVNKINKSYGELKVLQNFSCTFPANSFSCVTGKSGSGKTTLLRIILGLEKADSGDISFYTSEPRFSTSGPRFSAVFQENRLLENLSALSNILLVTSKTTATTHVSSPCEATAEIASTQKATADSFATDTTTRIKNMLKKIGIDPNESKPIKEFSGGMKRRVAIVRALAAEYDILIMDEPLKGLDEETKSQTIALIKEETQGKTVIMVTHDFDEITTFGANEVKISLGLDY